MAQGRLSGKVSVITGGAGGIGTATGKIFCREGSKVALVDLDNDALQAAVDQIRRDVPNAQVAAFVADLSEESAAQKVVDEILSRYNTLDILINNCGIRAYDRIADASWDKWDKIMRVNFLSYVSMTRACLPSLRTSRKGSIINISSLNAYYGRAGTGAYDAMKASILALTRTTAFEESSNGIRVNSICPGYTRTPFHEKRLGVEKLEEFKPPCVMGRWAWPEEIARPICFLASEEASYVTGASLVVDGGFPVQPAAT